jgi:hypothetical protein
VIQEGVNIKLGHTLLKGLIRPGPAFIMQPAIFQGDHGIELFIGLLEHTVGGIKHAAAEAHKENRGGKQQDKKNALGWRAEDTIRAVF